MLPAPFHNVLVIRQPVLFKHAAQRKRWWQNAAQKTAGGVEGKDGGFRAWLKCEGKKFIGPTHHGLNAYADAEVNRRRMCEANVSMASLEAVVAAIRAAAAATDADRSERAWKTKACGSNSC